MKCPFDGKGEEFAEVAASKPPLSWLGKMTAKNGFEKREKLEEAIYLRFELVNEKVSSLRL